MLSESHRVEGKSCTSIVEPNDVALRSGESWVRQVLKVSNAHTHRGPEERMEDICRVTERMNGSNLTLFVWEILRAHNLLESQGDILGSMNVVTHDLVLTEDPRARMDQMYGGPHSCHQQWTICGHRKFQPVCHVYQGHVKFLRTF
jgi:hypothetical protein